MLIVTTPILEGKPIKEYLGPVFAQATRGVGAGRGIAASFKALSGGRSLGHEKSIVEVRDKGLAEIAEEAKALGANAIIGLTLDYEMLSNDSLILCKVFGTAVVL